MTRYLLKESYLQQLMEQLMQD